MAMWPFSRAKNAQTYEKALVQLDKKILNCQKFQLTWNMRLRRVKGLVTLYSILLYMFYIIYLIAGRVDWSIINISGVAISPFLIWFVRHIIQLTFNWINNFNDEKYKALILEKEKVGEEIKESMNFYQAKAILDRFGLSHEEKPDKKKGKGKGKEGENDNDEKNKEVYISDGNSVQPQVLDQDQFISQNPSQAPFQFQGQLNNTFIPSFAPYEPKWYDRIFDLLVGEDEQSANSRYALICFNCRMHNGLAQFGEKPDNVIYICPHCGMKNGKELTEDVESDIESTQSNDNLTTKPTDSDVTTKEGVTTDDSADDNSNNNSDDDAHDDTHNSTNKNNQDEHKTKEPAPEIIISKSASKPTRQRKTTKQ